MIEPIAFAILGGLARLHDGGALIKKVPSNVIYALLTITLFTYLARPFDDNMLMLVTGAACLIAWANSQWSYKTLQRWLRVKGELGWHRWWNCLRYAPVTNSAVLLYWIGEGSSEWLAAYVIGLLFIGAIRPTFSKYAPHVKNWSRYYAEPLEGAVVFGGLAAVAL